MRVTRDGDVAVKAFPPAEVERAEREAALLMHLPPDPRYRVQSFVELVRTETGAALKTRWLAGRKKVYTEIDASEWRALGAMLAALHERLDTFAAALPRLAMEIDVAAAERDIDVLRARAPAFGRWLDVSASA